MRKICLLFIFCIQLFGSCTEPYGLQTETFESAIVIEATLTDELKHQEIKLSRTYKLEEDGPDMETGAVVYVTDNNGNQYNFSENNGKYISTQEFQAVPNVAYQLHVVTSDGKTYTSKTESLSSTTNIGSINPVAGLNSLGEKGVQILLSSTKSTGNTEYYRYTYEETHKIVAPHWIPQRGVAFYYNPPPPFDPKIGEVHVEPWPYEAKTCFKSASSDEILISNTSLNSTNNTVDLIRFLKVDDYKIANRYSIKVTMYNESQAAYNFYDALKKSSSNGSLLSQNQPGFFSGNIKNVANPIEKVIGFFDVAHVTTQRIFFNFEDVFPNDPKPPYPYFCPEITAANELDFTYNMCFSLPGTPSNCQGVFILNTLDMRIKTLYRFGTEQIMLVNSQCGDCTTFASNIRPSFWQD
ncbi:DUF4249 domain-containing protein [Flavobacterium amniphilum]|uniref:DUF4249 domain-containing protein n=1 Tax=Flavobacterium amniphilum TaxID=1834035 RepID=UPI002029CC4D|nr:DUF4249 domain-containing protein [Flavobacterium amniphilum]MCL9804710.1 DUF4249 domain-containing protein [Flavobacterium amniphilum]